MRQPKFTIYAKESGVEIAPCEKKQPGKPDEGRVALRFFKLAIVMFSRKVKLKTSVS